MLILDHLVVQLHHLLLQDAEALDRLVMQDAPLVLGARILLLSLLKQNLQSAWRARGVVLRLTTLLTHGQHLLHQVSLQAVDLELLGLAAVLQVSQLLLPRVRLEAPEVDESVKLINTVSDGTGIFTHRLLQTLQLLGQSSDLIVLLSLQRLNLLCHSLPTLLNLINGVLYLLDGSLTDDLLSQKPLTLAV